MTSNTYLMKRRNRLPLKKVFVYLLLTIGMVIALLPYLMMILSAFKTNTEGLASTPLPSSLRIQLLKILRKY